MKRVTVNLIDPTTARHFKARVARSKLSDSAFIVSLVEKDLRDAGLLPPDEVAVTAALMEGVSQATKRHGAPAVLAAVRSIPRKRRNTRD